MRSSGIHQTLGYTGRQLRDAAESLLPPEWSRPESPLRLSGQVTASGALVEIVSFIAHAGRTGTLIVASGEIVRAIGFDNGALIGAATTRAQERIGDLLRKAGHVSREDLEAAAYTAALAGKVLGEVLVEAGQLERATLDETLRRQAEEILMAALRIDVGAFALFDDLTVPRAPGTPRTVISLMMEATRRSENMGVFRQTIGTLDHVPVRREEAGSVAPDLVKVLEHCDGEHSIGEIAVDLGLFEFEIMHAIHRLATSELIDVLEPRIRSTTDVLKVSNDALVNMHRRCDRVKVGAMLRADLEDFLATTSTVAAMLREAEFTASGAFVVDALLRSVASGAKDELLELAIHEYLEFASDRATELLRDKSEQMTVAATG